MVKFSIGGKHPAPWYDEGARLCKDLSRFPAIQAGGRAPVSVQDKNMEAD